MMRQTAATWDRTRSPKLPKFQASSCQRNKQLHGRHAKPQHRILPDHNTQELHKMSRTNKILRSHAQAQDLPTLQSRNPEHSTTSWFHMWWTTPTSLSSQIYALACSCCPESCKRPTPGHLLPGFRNSQTKQAASYKYCSCVFCNSHLSVSCPVVVPLHAFNVHLLHSLVKLWPFFP